MSRFQGLSKLDFFPHRSGHPKHKSVGGFILTVIFFVLFTSFVVFFAQDFSKNSVSQLLTYRSHDYRQGTQIPQVRLTYSDGGEDVEFKNGLQFHNYFFFDVRWVKQQWRTGDDGKPERVRDKIPVPLVECLSDNADDPLVQFGSTICVSQTVGGESIDIRGRYTDPEFHYLQIRLAPCFHANNNLPAGEYCADVYQTLRDEVFYDSRGGGVKSSTDKEVDMRLDLRYTKTWNSDSNSYEDVIVTEDFRLAFSNNVTYLPTDVYLKRVETTIEPRYIIDGSQTTLGAQYDKLAVYTREWDLDRLQGSTDDAGYMTVYLRVSDNDVLSKVAPKTLMGMFSLVGGAWTILTIIIGRLLASNYNLYKQRGDKFWCFDSGDVMDSLRGEADEHPGEMFLVDGHGRPCARVTYQGSQMLLKSFASQQQLSQFPPTAAANQVEMAPTPHKATADHVTQRPSSSSSSSGISSHAGAVRTSTRPHIRISVDEGRQSRSPSTSSAAHVELSSTSSSHPSSGPSHHSMHLSVP